MFVATNYLCYAFASITLPEKHLQLFMFDWICHGWNGEIKKKFYRKNYELEERERESEATKLTFFCVSSLKITVFAPEIFQLEVELISELVFFGFFCLLVKVVIYHFLTMIESIVTTSSFLKNKSFVYKLQNLSLNNKSALVAHHSNNFSYKT